MNYTSRPSKNIKSGIKCSTVIPLSPHLAKWRHLKTDDAIFFISHLLDQAVNLD